MDSVSNADLMEKLKVIDEKIDQLLKATEDNYIASQDRGYGLGTD